MDEEELGGIVPVRRILRKPGRASAAAPPAASAASAAAAAPSSSASAVVAPSLPLSGVPTSTASAGAPTNKLRTAFARESDELIEARKAAARLPLQRDPRTFVDPARVAREGGGGTPSGDYYAKDQIPIPVRPPWQRLTAAQVEAQEVAAHKRWLESIYARFPPEELNMFEHNLEVWRQLWRVCERSDILMVVVDSRQPILNFPPSLYQYITSTLRKPMLLVLNKIDLIPAAVVNDWIAFFRQRYPKLHVVPFTSFPTELREKLDVLVKSKAKRGKGRTLLKPFGATELLEACRQVVAESSASLSLPDSVRRNFSFDATLLSGGSQAVEADTQVYAGADEYMRAGGIGDDDDIGASSLSQELKQMGVLKSRSKSAHRASRREQLAAINRKHRAELAEEAKAGGLSDIDSDDEADEAAVEENSRAYSGALGVLEEEDGATGRRDDFITLGCIGQPNAGKSSLINALAGRKLVSVSKTPGHTKYLQTLFLNPATRLCDCPGLVFPAVGMPKAVQVLSGAFPIAQTRDPYSAVQFLAERMPLETIYKLTPPAPMSPTPAGDGASSTERPSAGDATASSGATPAAPFQWSAWTLCEAVASQKGFFSRQGTPDVYRAANFILREVLDGVITLYFLPPTQ